MEFNVIIWDINRNTIVPYDVLPYFRKKYNECENKPITKEQWESFIISKGKYQFWSRCEYEIIVSPWPSQNKKLKIDVWSQIEINLPIIVDILMSEFNK